MKYFYFLSVILFTTSCKKPDCGPLSEPALASLAWMKPYEGKPFEVFEDQFGNVDTIMINFMKTELTCIDCNCDFNCSRAKVTFQSVTNKDVHFTVETNGPLIEFNNPDSLQGLIQAKFDAVRNIPTMINSFSLIFPDHFSPANDPPKNIEVIANFGTGKNMAVSRIRISIDSGLVRFDTMDENVWLKKE